MDLRRNSNDRQDSEPSNQRLNPLGGILGRTGFGNMFSQMDRMMQESIERSQNGSGNGPYFSSFTSSSVTTVGADGIPTSESKAVSRDSTGKCKMAHQRRVGDRAQTLTRARNQRDQQFQDAQHLRQLTHEQLPEFRKDFSERSSSFARLGFGGAPSIGIGARRSNNAETREKRVKEQRALPPGRRK